MTAVTQSKRPWPFLVANPSSPRKSLAYVLAMAQLDHLIAARGLLVPSAGRACFSSPEPAEGTAVPSIPCGNYGDNLSTSTDGGKSE